MLVLASCAISLSLASGQQVLTLSDALSLSIRDRPEAQAARAAIGGAIGRLQQARSGGLPTIVIQGAATDGPQGAPGFGPLQNPSLLGSPPLSLEGIPADPLKKQYGAGLTINQTLFDFGRTRFLTSSRSSLVSAARSDARAELTNVLLSVETAYYAVIHAQGLVRIQEQNLKQRDVTLRQAKAFVAAQLRSGVDEQTAQADFEEANAALIEAKGAESNAYAELNHAMGQTSLVTYALAAGDADEGTPPSSGDDAMKQALTNRPEIAGARQEADAAEKLMKGVRGDLLPRLDAIAGVGALRLSSLIPSEKNYAVGLVLSIPVFAGGYTQGRLREESAHVTSARARLRQVEEAVKLQAAQAWLDLDARQAKLKAEQARSTAAERNLSLARERYRLQLSTIVEVTEAETLAIRAAEELTDAEYGVRLAQAVLRVATGSAYQARLDGIGAKR